MRSRSLQAALTAFVEEAAAWLAAERAGGAELPYDVVEAGSSRRGGTHLYCYRPMTGEFIVERADRLTELETHLPAVQALAAIEGVGRYLQVRGRCRVPADRRRCAETALILFLAEVFEETSEFEVPRDRLARSCELLESAVSAGLSQTIFAGALRGMEIASPEIPLGAGLALVRRDSFADCPPDALLGSVDEHASVFAVLSVEAAPGETGAVEEARQTLCGLTGALQLFGDTSVALGPLGWMRVDAAPWQTVAIGREAPTRGRLGITRLQEDELRAFCSLMSRRAPQAGELAWALERFRMGLEREDPWQTLTDHLLGLRALLEPEGPQSGRLAGRLAALCALPEDRSALAERTAEGVALERAVVSGLAEPDGDARELVDEITDHLRALLRDVLCGHLDADLVSLADRLIVELVEEQIAEAAEEEYNGEAGDPAVEDSAREEPDPAELQPA